MPVDHPELLKRLNIQTMADLSKQFIFTAAFFIKEYG
jgi:hypothetical protein